MIHRGSYKPEILLERVARYVRPNDRPPTALAADGVYYLGDGYWRAAPVEEDGKLAALRLINPSRTAEEITTVERAICILGGFEYQEG